MPKDLPSPETLRKLLRYEPETGKLFWRERGDEFFVETARGAKFTAKAWNSRSANKEAFTAISFAGYRMGGVFGDKYYAHRVAWAIFHGEWPLGQIDHINGDRSDNRVKNLRVVNNAQNGRNQKRKSNNTSGITGVYWHSRDGRWQARIKFDYDEYHLGNFKCITAAMIARKLAEQKYGFHANHGR